MSYVCYSILMQRIFKHLIIITFSLISMVINGQNPIQNNLLHTSNLPDTEFYDIIEDDKHNILLAADKGLFVYNGYDYKKYTHTKQKGSSVFGLQKDNEGRVWCNNLYGQLFYVEHEKLELFLDVNDITNGQFSYFKVFDDYVLVFSNSGIYEIAVKSKDVKQISKQSIVSTLINKNSSYFYSQSKAFSIQVFKDKKEKNVTSLNINNIESSGFFEIDSNRILFKYKENLKNHFYSINANDNTFLKIPTPQLIQHLEIYNIISIDGKLWFCTTKGVYVYEFIGGNLQYIDTYFKEESVTDIHKDFNANYWFLTIDNGVFVVPNLYFEKVKIEQNFSKLSSVCKLEQNNFVVGTKNGQLLFYKGNTLENVYKLPTLLTINSLSYDAYNEHLIISSNNSKSFVLDLNTNQLKDLGNQYSVAKSIQVIDLKTVFYGNYKEAKVYTNNTVELLRSKRVITSKYLGNNKLLIAFIDGLYLYDLEQNSVEEIKDGDVSLMISCITKTEDKTWLLSQDATLWSLENNRLKIEKEFDAVEIQNITSDDEYLWIFHKDGLIKHNSEKHTISKLSYQDGFELNPQHIVVLKDDLILTSPTHFYRLPKQDSKLFKNITTADVELQSLSVNDKDTILKDGYQLDYNQNKIRIDFVSNGYLSNKQMHYRYKLKPLDQTWQNVSRGNNFMEFKELQSGAYTFEVEAKHSSASQYSKGASLAFSIQSPFWETWWFYALIFAFIVLLLFLIFKWRLQIKEKKREEEINKILLEKKMASLKLENFRSQMNPHFIFNALNSIQDYIISNEKELASTYLVKFSRLIRMYLDYSQQNEITLQQEIKALELYLELEKVRFEDELDYKIDIENNLDIKAIKVPSLFIQPYIENALKHGLLHKKGERRLQIIATKDEGKLKVVIEDNGIGRQQAKTISEHKRMHKPFATKANAERIHIYKTKLKKDINVIVEDLDVQGAASGTRVNIYIPIKF